MPAKPLKIPDALLDRYQAGDLNAAELGRLLGVSAPCALQELRRLGIDTSKGTRVALAIARRKGFASAAAMYGRVVDLYGQGSGIVRVAEATGLTAEGVRQVLLRQGVKLRPRGTAGHAR
jgi:hypothetical protein